MFMYLMFRLRDRKKGSLTVQKLPDGVLFFDKSQKNRNKGPLRHDELYHIDAVASACLASFVRAGDAMMNLCDVLLCETQAHTLAELSLSPYFERQWPSAYEALEDGRIDVPLLRRSMVHVKCHAPPAYHVAEDSC